MILEIGCSNANNHNMGRAHFASNIGHADVSIDVQKPKIRYKIPNLILADAQYLPFRNDVFTHIFCSHVIEHVKNPFQLLQEAFRVASNLNLICPHRYSAHAKMKDHLFVFNAKWFQKAFDVLGGIMYSITTTLGLFNRPDELIVEAHKVIEL